MLNLNDDMDDLIRQAAEDYPLKIKGNDWDKIAGAMQSATVTTQPAKGKKYLWLLLLLLPLFIAIPFIYKDNNTRQSAIHSSARKAGTVPAEQTAGKSINRDTAAVSKGKLSTPQTTLNSISESKADKVPSEEKQQAEALNSPGHLKATIANSSRSTASAGNNKSNSLTGISVKSSNYVNVLPDLNTVAGSTLKNAIENNSMQAADSSLPSSEQANKRTGELENTSPLVDSSSKNMVAVIPQEDSTATFKKMTIKHTTAVKTKKLYAGLAAGLDVSSVKFHEINKIGHSTSLLVGYRINNKWSIESGVMWDNKHYYSPGDYFDKSRTGIPADDHIHFLNGTCRMFEVPLNIKYDFGSKKLSGFFVSAGLSSYFMKKENYEYHATYNGDYYVGYKQYKNSTNNIFSVANINGGYQFIFKNNNSLRIEPYIKIPLSGLGIGKLPFSSTGISAAYTLPLH